MPGGAESFPKRVRLVRGAEFRRTFGKGRRFKAVFFTAVVCPNHQELARLGLAVSKRNAKRAVERNRLKRLIRESFRVNQQSLSGRDIVVITRAGATATDASALRQCLAGLWQDIGDRAGRGAAPCAG